jgi:protein-export SecD/SecF family membrane protein
MNRQQSTILIFTGVLILFIASALFVFPMGFGKVNRPWRLGLDLVGGSYLVYEIDMKSVSVGDRDSVVNGLQKVMESRINAFGVSEPQVYSAKEGDSYRLIVELAGIKDVKEAVQQIGRTALLNFREVKQDASGTPEFIPTQLTGRYLQSAKVGQDPNSNLPLIEIQFNDEGAKLFEDITGKNIQHPLAIFIDEDLISAPVVQDKISGGKATITGRFTIDEVTRNVNLFNAGALPAPINLVSQQTVSATLGANSLLSAVYAGLVGTLAVILFMLIYYQFFGIFSSIALIIYTALTLAIFKLFGITMTLSGIAGFILSIGMAVDANILIFERTKEELKRGLVRVSAIEEGFRRAWTSIRDSNISTIITALILYYYTSSFVRGFALTLLIGVLVSMFSAITVTRTLLRIFVKNQSVSPVVSAVGESASRGKPPINNS